MRPAGIDLNCNGDVLDSDGDLIWHEAPSGDGARDIYLELRWMEGGGYVYHPSLGRHPPARARAQLGAMPRWASGAESPTRLCQRPQSGAESHQLDELPLPGHRDLARRGGRHHDPLDPELPGRIDFSHGYEADLNEASLDETSGINVGVAPFDRDVTRFATAGGVEIAVPSFGPIDWNRDGVLETSVSADINGNGTSTDVLLAHDEWQSLLFDFQCQEDGAD